MSGLDSQGTMALLRSMRSALYRIAAPLDFAFRKVNRLGEYPPLHLRRHAGHLGAGLNGPGYEFVAYLRLLDGLSDGDWIWDLGCGCGMLELALEDLGWRGRLVGTDLHKPSIDWAQRRIGSRIPSWEFVHSDIYNGAYWRRGTLTAREWLSSFDRRGFDIVVAKSFFTHLLPDELEIYLEAISERMRPDGSALLTFFLLDEEQRRLAKAGQNRITFHQAGTDPHYKVRTPMAPTAAVAYEKGYLLERMEDNGLRVAEDSIHKGVWTGYAQGLSFQDIILATK